MISRITNTAFSNAHILLCLTTLFWGGNFVLGRGVAGHFPPIALAWFRWVLAFMIFLPFALPELKKDWPVIKSNIVVLSLLGVLSVGTFNTLSYVGLAETTAINGLVLQSAGPVLIGVFAYLFFRDRMTALQIFGIITSLIGVILVISKADIVIMQQMQINRGDIWIFAAMIVWAVYTVFLRLRPAIHWKSFAAVTFFIGALFITPFYLWEHSTGYQVTFDTASLLSIAYVCIFPSILSYVFFARGVELIGANRAGAYLHMAPLFGAVMAIVLLGEKLQLYHVIGFALILAGVALASRKQRGE